MDDPLTRERIDRYLLGKASPEDLAWVRRLIEEDPAFAQAIQESEAAVRVIRTARYQELRKQLIGWEHLASTRTRIRNRMKIISAAGILLMMLIWCTMSWLYNPARLAINSFHHTPHMMLSSDISPEVKDLFHQGDMAFKNKEFQKAIVFFSTYLQTGNDNYSGYAQWYILLCRLAWKGADETWRQDMIMFLNTAPPSLEREGRDILQACSSPIFRIMHGQKLQRSFSLIKPNII